MFTMFLGESDVTTTNFTVPEILNPRQRRYATEFVFSKIAAGFLSRIGSELFVLVKNSGVGVGIARSWSRMFENDE